MLHQINRKSLAVLGLVIFLSIADIQNILEAGEINTRSAAASLFNSGDPKGYRDVLFFNDKYIAVGTDGRIDCISQSGEKVNVNSSTKYDLNCIYSNGKIIISAGDHGTLLYSSNGIDFYHAESGINENINGVTSKNGLIIAGANNGKILISRDGKIWNISQTNAKGNIMSLSASNSFFIGVTDTGEIIKSSDGKNWEVKDYNKEYAGYNEPAKFKKIITTPNCIAIIGTHNDGSPSILFSTMGNVWAERIPIYHDEKGMICYLTKTPNGVTYDPFMDEIIIACDNGELFSLPSCAKCNKYIKISDINFNAIIFNKNSLEIVGDGYTIFNQKL